MTVSDTATLRRPPRAGAAGDALVLRAYQRCEWSDLALMRHGFTAERLQKLAYKIANDELRLRGAVLGNRHEDLISKLVEAGLACAFNFDPDRRHSGYGKNGGEPFASYAADVMALRVIDFYRQKAQGFGDRRKGHDNMIELSDDPDPADHDTDFEFLVDERRRAKWQRAAEAKQLTLSQFVVSVLDIAAENVVEAA